MREIENKTAVIKKSVNKNRKLNKSTSGKGNKKKTTCDERIITLSFILFLIAIFSIVVFYTVFIFPKKLDLSIKDNLIEIYNPIFYEDTENMLILKTKEIPGEQTNFRLIEVINNNYGLEVKFEKIVSSSEKGINKILFYKNNKNFNDLKEIYIYWDNKIENLNLEEKNKKKDITLKEKNEKIKERNEIKSETENYIQSKKIINENKINSNINQKKKIEYPYTEDSDKILIIVDDVGYSNNSLEKFLSLGFPITFAIIPDLPLSKKYYELLLKNNYNILIHIPMEPQRGRQFVEKNGLFIGMEESEIKDRISNYFRDYPFAIGANNHMGSKAVTDAKLMNILINELSKNNKIWIDSMTNKNSISREIALINNIPYYERDVFLDNEKDINSIRNSMDLLVKEAKKKKYAIGIGHIQSENLVLVLKEYYDRRKELKIDFVDIDRLK